MSDFEPRDGRVIESGWLTMVVCCCFVTRKIGEPPRGAAALSPSAPTVTPSSRALTARAHHRHSNLLHIIGSIGRNGMESHTNNQVIVSLIVATFDTVDKGRFN